MPGVLVRRIRPMKAGMAPRNTMALGFGDVGGGDAGDQVEEGDQDDDEAGEEGGLRRRRVGEAGGLEAVAKREEETCW